MRVSVLCFLIQLFCYPFSLQAQDVRTIQLFNSSSRLSYPVIRLGSEESLTLEFDDLSSTVEPYTYTIVPCNSNWEEQELDPMLFVDGFVSSDILQYHFSQSTLTDYIHYRMQLPNIETRFVSSGNFKVQVYLEDYKVFERRFYVVESEVKLKAGVRLDIQDNDNQSIMVEVEVPNSNELQDLEQYKLNISQNNRIDREFLNVPFTNHFEYKIEYKLNTNNVFFSGEEFRFFNTNEVNILPAGMEQVEFQGSYYLFSLKPYEFVKKTVYKNLIDLNGKFSIDATLAEKKHVQSDYVKVHFSIKPNVLQDPLTYYLVGSFNEFRPTQAHQFFFDEESKLYILDLLLKQGFYNYKFRACHKQTEKELPSQIENNFAETENDYLIFFYYRKLGEYIDRIVGYRLLNSQHTTQAIP